MLYQRTDKDENFMEIHYKFLLRDYEVKEQCETTAHVYTD